MTTSNISHFVKNSFNFLIEYSDLSNKAALTKYCCASFCYLD